MSTNNSDGSELTGAWSEFVARALEAAKRKAGEALTQALTPAPGIGDAPGGVEGLVAMYRQYLGEMANYLPVIARYISGQAKPVEGKTRRLILRISTRDQMVAMVAKRTAKEAAGEDGPFVLYMTEAAIKDCAARLSAQGISQSRILPVLCALQKELARDGTLDLGSKLDDLKYDYRRRGADALPDIRDALSEFLDQKLDECYSALKQLKLSLGEDALRSMIDQKMLIQLAKTIAGIDKWGTDDLRITDFVWSQLFSRFQKAGIQLSARLSVLSGRHEGYILDHGNDDTYEVKYSERFYDVYGERQSRQFKYTVNKPEQANDAQTLSDTEQTVLTPVRVMDTSQGFMAWSVDKRILQELMDTARNRLEAWDTGNGKGLAMLYVGDHREGDLGAYRELMLGCLATPCDQPLAVGLWMLGQVPVSSMRAKAASKEIWGFEKTLARIDLEYSSRSVTCELRPENASAEAAWLLQLKLPRAGAGVSTALPLLFYSLKDYLDPEKRTDDQRTQPVLHRTLVTRSGTGEQLRGGGGGTALSVHKACPLYELLRQLDLVDCDGKLIRTPRFSAWSESVWGEASAPQMVLVLDPAPQ
jgi:hypothetical protein